MEPIQEHTVWMLSLLYILIIFVMFYTWKVSDRFPGTGSWAIGYIGCCTGSIFAMLFLTGPCPALYGLGFSLLIAGVEFIVRGCGVFLGSPVDKRLSALVILLGSLLSFSLYPDPRLHAPATGAVFIFVLLRGFRLFLRNVRKIEPAGYFPALAFLAPVLLFLYTSLLLALPAGSLPAISLDLHNTLYALLFAAMAYMLSILVYTKYHQELKANAREKEMLLREMHHRTKNNLALVASMISLEAGEFDDERTREAFSRLEDKILAVALLHKKLQSTGTAVSVRADEYLGLVAGSASESLARMGVALNTDLEPLDLDSSRAIPVGLILNELVTNARKHAFAGKPGGSILVSFRKKDGVLELAVEDDGVGMKEKPSCKDSLGLSLVCTLASQLKGEFGFDFEYAVGTRAVLTFPA